MEFKCLTRDRLGKVSTNIVKGRDVATIVTNLKRDGYLALKVQEIKESKNGGNSLFTLTNKRVKLKEIVVFTRQLAATLSAGLVLVEALEVVADEMENKYFQTIILGMRSDIQGGMDFSTALSRYPHIFSLGYVY